MKLTNLEKVIEELNAPFISPAFEYEGIRYESSVEKSFYSFKYVVEDKTILIYDSNEYFHMDLDEEIRCTVFMGCKEFGVKYETPESVVEKIIQDFKAAIEKDLKRKDIIVEWQNNVVLSVYMG